MPYKYKNKTNQNQIIPGVGQVEANGEIVSNQPIENPNFEFIDETGPQKNSVVGTEARQPGAVTDAKLKETE